MTKLTEKFWAVSNHTPPPGSNAERLGMPRQERHPNRASYAEALKDLSDAADAHEDWQTGQIHKAFMRAEA